MTDPARTIALIGATSGLGRAAADQLAKEGHNLILVGRDPARAQRLARQLPAAVVIGADVSTSAGVDFDRGPGPVFSRRRQRTAPATMGSPSRVSCVICHS
jgi:NAD(P)-dependent dehydrogenase (short-subunit alcohol dehydrogenase family)